MRIIRIFFAFASLLLLCPAISARSNSANQTCTQIFALSTKYSSKKGVVTMACEDGFKLRTAKSIIRKDFGQEFADNVEAFAILIYKDATAELADMITADIGLITNTLLNVDIKERIKKEGAEAIGYVKLTDDKQFVTDIVVLFKKPAPMLIYIGGKFKADNM